jgi:hypothetical protein
MTSKKPATNVHDAPKPITQRFCNLLTSFWRGNQSQMGRDLGVAQTVISRVSRGQEPPYVLMEALASYEAAGRRINLNWLLRGDGDPFLAAPGDQGSGLFVPLARQLLPGPPQEYPHLLDLRQVAVVPAMHSPTAYGYVLLSEDAITQNTAEKVAVGDVILLETAPAWTKDLDRCRGRLCAFRLGGSTPAGVVLGRIGYMADFEVEGEEYPVDTFGHFPQAVLAAKPTGRRRAATGSPAVVRFDLRDIVGTFRELQRAY